MRIRVYHLKSEHFPVRLGRHSECRFPEQYVHAADVETESEEFLDHAFRVTNHISHEWWDNPGVTKTDASHRSTSVGDVVEGPDGRRWICASLGWEEMKQAEEAVVV